jgi:hypothetical protein
LHPTKFCSSAQVITDSDDNITVVAWNLFTGSTRLYKSHALTHILTQSELSGATFHLNIKEAIADSGATQIFVMEGTSVINKCKTTQPLKVALNNGRQVMSTHMCNIYIKSLPTVLRGHIIPNVSNASLVGIQALTDAGCKVIFDHEGCTVQYNGKIIISGGKDSATDLWTLPLGLNGMTSHHVHDEILPVAPVCTNAHAYHFMQIPFFTHTVQTKANSIRFAHHPFAAPRSLPCSRPSNAGTSKVALTLQQKGYLNS